MGLQAAEGAGSLVTHGFVTAATPGRGLFITFYNKVHGLVSEAELAASVRGGVGPGAFH